MKNTVLELSFQSPVHVSDPFNETVVDVEITKPGGGTSLHPAFWASGNQWRLRFSSPEEGTFRYQTVCSGPSNPGLHGRIGEIEVLPREGTNPLGIHGPLTIAPAGNYIQHLDGTPFFWLADCWWHGVTKRFRWPDDFRQLTEDRREKGFSVIQIVAGFPCDIGPFDERGANEAGFPMTEDYKTINPAYFDLVDLRIAHLVDRGLVPNIFGTWGYHLPWMGVDTLKRYWRYLIARYGAYPAVWTVAGEAALTWYPAKGEERDELLRKQRQGLSEIASFIKQTDPYGRIVTVHPGPASGSFRPIEDMSEIDIVMTQPGHNGWETIGPAASHLKKAMAMYPGRPVMQGEVCFEGMMGGGSGPKVQRILFWTNVLSGAAGHCYGADGIWQFNTRERLFGASPLGHVWGNAPWEEAHRWEGSFHVGLGKKILERFEWWRFEPRPEWIHPNAEGGDELDAYAAGIPGEIRAFYFPRGVKPWGQPYTVRHLNDESAYSAMFIDPRTGVEYPVDETIRGATEWEVPAAPILQDWLLTLTIEN